MEINVFIDFIFVLISNFVPEEEEEMKMGTKEEISYGNPR